MVLASTSSCCPLQTTRARAQKMLQIPHLSLYLCASSPLPFLVCTVPTIHLLIIYATIPIHKLLVPVEKGDSIFSLPLHHRYQGGAPLLITSNHFFLFSNPSNEFFLSGILVLIKIRAVKGPVWFVGGWMINHQIRSEKKRKQCGVGLWAYQSNI